MLVYNSIQNPQIAEKLNPFINFPSGVDINKDPKVVALLVDHSPDTPRDERQKADRKSGKLRNLKALPGLSAALGMLKI
jgi:hypothetical protein